MVYGPFCPSKLLHFHNRYGSYILVNIHIDFTKQLKFSSFLQEPWDCDLTCMASEWLSAGNMGLWSHMYGMWMSIYRNHGMVISSLCQVNVYLQETWDCDPTCMASECLSTGIMGWWSHLYVKWMSICRKHWIVISPIWQVNVYLQESYDGDLISMSSECLSAGNIGLWSHLYAKWMSIYRNHGMVISSLCQVNVYLQETLDCDPTWMASECLCAGNIGLWSLLYGKWMSICRKHWMVISSLWQVNVYLQEPWDSDLTYMPSECLSTGNIGLCSHLYAKWMSICRKHWIVVSHVWHVNVYLQETLDCDLTYMASECLSTVIMGLWSHLYGKWMSICRKHWFVISPLCQVNVYLQETLDYDLTCMARECLSAANMGLWSHLYGKWMSICRKHWIVISPLCQVNVYLQESWDGDLTCMASECLSAENIGLWSHLYGKWMSICRKHWFVISPVWQVNVYQQESWDGDLNCVARECLSAENIGLWSHMYASECLSAGNIGLWSHLYGKWMSICRKHWMVISPVCQLSFLPHSSTLYSQCWSSSEVHSHCQHHAPTRLDDGACSLVS